MHKQITHPSQKQLSAYNRGLLSPDEAVAIETHVSDCEPCCETIVGLSSEDTFVGLLKEARQLPVDQTLDHHSQASQTPSYYGDIPPELDEHPRYEIVRLIGKGGMGDVYEAIHRKMERRVALKVINRELFQKAEAVNRFHREVKTAAQLSHPNIVTSHDADQAGEHHFMVMEYVDGIDLSHFVKDRGALPVAEACDYIRQAAIGLQHAHERGMVHRDIKPHNLMVTGDGTIKILDFGLASLAPEAIPASGGLAASSDLTAAGAIMGTPDFISPEQAEDARQVDIRSDIYSLGATFYYLLSGQVPFVDGSVMHKLKSHAQVEPAPLDSVRDDVPEELVAIVSKMMAKDADERYLTPSEVAAALESFLRTWQPDEENTPREGASNGGNDSGSGGQKPLPDDSNPSRLPMVAKLLLYTSLLPIGLIFVNEFVPLPLFSGETDWFWYCVLTSIALSTIGGIVLGVHQGISSIRDGQRVKGKTTDQTLLIIICLAVSAFVILNRMSNSNMRIELTPQSDRIILGTHPLTIVNTSGEKPFGGTHRTYKDNAAGITTRSFESANGRYKITLVDKVLTVNGERYTLENPTDAIRIVDDRVEITKVTTLTNGERFDSQTLPDNIDVEQIVDRMTKVYAECKSYTDTGVIESVVRETPDSPNMIIDHSFTTAFVRPGRIRFEIENEDKEKLLISANESNIQTWWDLEPGIRKPASLDLAFAEGLGFAGGNVGHIPALLMPQKLEVWEASLKVVEPKRIYERKLENVECYCLEFKFDEQRTVLWIDKQSYLILQIEQSIKTEDNYYEWRTTFNPTINDNVTEQMLEFDPPSPRSADDNANTIPEEELKQLQGDWESVSVTEGGKQLATENGFGGLLLQIKGNKFVITERKPNGEKSEVDTGRIEIDITTSPKTIDFIGRDERRLGIYELKDDLLRLCLIERSGTDAPEEKRVPGSKTLKRPTTFDSPTGSNIMLMEFRRKQTEPSSQAQGGLLNDVIDDDQPLLQGTWRVVFVEDSGRTGTPQMPDGQQVEIEFIFADNKLTTVMPDRTSVATFQLNPSTSPKSIDVTENGRTKPGIYEIEGDSLRVCFSEFTDERPTSR